MCSHKEGINFHYEDIEMRKLPILLLLAVTFSADAADTYVDGYYRDNGTYVNPHYRTTPNDATWDNYSTRGNSYENYGRSDYGYSNRSYGGSMFDKNDGLFED